MNDKWVLVTGGAHRLGRGFCLAFARAGWNVACHYGQSAQAAEQLCQVVRELGRQAFAVAGDLAQAGAGQALFARMLDGMGGRAPDAIVNSASSFEPDSALELSPDVLARQLQVNLAAPLQLGSLLGGQIVRELAEQGQKRSFVPALIHVLDQKVLNLNPDYFSYTVSKLALERAVALQAQALAPHVRVSGVAPGLVFPSGPQSGDDFARTSKVNLLQQTTSAEDVARTAVFLAENPSITGVVVAVDSGQHLVPTERDIMFVQARLVERP